MPVIPELGSLSNEDCCEFEASQNYTAKSCHKQKSPKVLSRVLGITRTEKKMAILELISFFFSIKVSNFTFH